MAPRRRGEAPSGARGDAGGDSGVHPTLGEPPCPTSPLRLARAARCSGTYCVTVSVDRVRFNEPVRVEARVRGELARRVLRPIPPSEWVERLS